MEVCTTAVDKSIVALAPRSYAEPLDYLPMHSHKVISAEGIDWAPYTRTSDATQSAATIESVSHQEWTTIALSCLKFFY